MTGDLLNFDFSEKDLGPFSWPHLVYAFSRKIFLMLTISLPETWQCTFKALSNISDGAFLDDDDDDDDGVHELIAFGVWLTEERILPYF